MKFKVGDRVKCIKGPEAGDKGAGWIENHEFVISAINPFGKSTNDESCYFGTKDGYGTYESHLEKVSKPPHYYNKLLKETINKIQKL